MILDEMYEAIKDMANGSCATTPNIVAEFKAMSKEQKAGCIEDMHQETLKLIKILKGEINKICKELDAKIVALKPNPPSNPQSDFWSDWPGRN